MTEGPGNGLALYHLPAVLPKDTVNRVRRNWFGELERVEGRGKLLDYVYITECGQFAGRVRFHILMNGKQIGFKWDWMRCWIELGGEDAILYYYRPGFFRYALQSANDDSDLDIIMSDGGPFVRFFNVHAPGR